MESDIWDEMRYLILEKSGILENVANSQRTFRKQTELYNPGAFAIFIALPRLHHKLSTTISKIIKFSILLSYKKTKVWSLEKMFSEKIILWILSSCPSAPYEIV